jgi:hypothetical protein
MLTGCVQFMIVALGVDVSIKYDTIDLGREHGSKCGSQESAIRVALQQCQ